MFGRCQQWGTSLLLLATLALVAGMGCRKELPELFDRNNPPETYITSAPVESLFDAYKVRVHWHGEDRDGEISYYLWAWTDSSNAYYNAWNPESNPQDRILQGGDFNATHLTTRTDSVFTLLANEYGGMNRDLSFNITAVDDQGRRDPVPARLYFNASVDRRPEIVWVEEPYGDLDPGAAWVGTQPETLSAGQPFSCAFTGTTINGFVKGFQWNYGGGTLWLPIVNGQTGWTYQDPELALLDTVRLDFSNDIEGADLGMTDFYDNGIFRIKSKCIDQAGVESSVITSNTNPVGVITPILNGDPDTRLRTDIPVLVHYKNIDGLQETITPEVERVDTGVGSFHYRINEPLPWGQDMRVEVHLQGWDYDDPLVVDEALMRYQLGYTWRIKNLSLLDEEGENTFSTGSSIGRYPPGGIIGGQENLGYGYFGESGWHFQMNLGPMDYQIKGYAIDHFGRVDGTPMILEVQGGYSPELDSIILVSKYTNDDDITTYSPVSVNLSQQVPEGETIKIDLASQFYQVGSLPLANRMLWDPDTYTAQFQPVYLTSGFPHIAGTYHITFRVYGHDNILNGESAKLAGILWDLIDLDFPEDNAIQFGEHDNFYIEEGGYIKDWQYLPVIDEPYIGYHEITLAIHDDIFFTDTHDAPMELEETPIWLGAKDMSSIFRNTYPSDRFTALIETGQQSNQPMGSKGRSSEPKIWKFDIQYKNVLLAP